jgi:S1-C subfamily serine protease
MNSQWARPDPTSAFVADAPTAAPRRWWPWVLVAGLGVAVITTVATVVIVSVVDRLEPGATCPTADGRTRELRRCMQPVLAFVETPFGSGSGVLIDGGYVVTNAHVVDPFAEATITLGDRRVDDVEVVGVDAFADIAVLGPIETDTEGVELVSLDGFDEDEEPEVFLLGYPGGVEGDDPAITISDGVVSRLRADDVTGLRYVQTDAAISGGQSGGALVDGSGRVLGISGLGFAEEFALALSADDVIAAIDRIRAGDGDARRTLPVAGDAALGDTAEFSLDDLSRRGALMFPAGPSRKVKLTIQSDAELGVDISTTSGDVIGSNQTFLDQLVEDEMFTEDEVVDMPLLDETAPGVYQFELPDDEVTYVDISIAEGTADVTVDADEPFVAYGGTVTGDPVAVGATVRGVLDGFAVDAVHTLTIDEPGTYVVSVSAGASDAYVTVLAPGESYDPDAEPSADDDGGGLYGFDAEYEFEVDPDATGEWTIVAGTWDGVITGYTLRVERGR